MPFAPNSVEMAAATQFSVQGALQKWLSGYIKVQSVVASAEEAVLTVTVTYSPLNTDVTQVQTFVYGSDRMIYGCCDENRKAAVLGNPAIPQRHRLPRGAGPEVSFRAGQSAAADSAGLLPECAADDFHLVAQQHPDHGRRKHHQDHGGLGRARLRAACGSESHCARNRHTSRPCRRSNVLVVRTNEAGDFSTVSPCAW